MPASAQPIYRCVGQGDQVYFGTEPLPDARCERIERRPAVEPAQPSGTPSGARATDAAAGPREASSPQDSAAQTPATRADGASGLPAPPRLRDATPPREPVPPFVDASANTLQFTQIPALAAFRRKWEQAGVTPIRIAHFGDSHLQGGHAAEVLRARLQAVRGKGGRGMVFPHAIARTYSHSDYSSTFTGQWVTASSMQLSPRLPLGVAGFTARTEDSLGAFTFRFNPPLDPGPKKLRLFMSTTSPRAMVIATTTAQEASRVLTPDSPGALEFAFDQLGDFLRFDFLNLDDRPGTFDLHGVSIENPGAGLIHDNLGVGGATFNALNLQRLFSTQVAQLAPDAFILDWGTNDLIYRNRVPDDLREQIVDTIQRIRSQFPQALIVLTSVQDMKYKGRKVTAAKEFSRLVRSIAAEQGCLFWDWYRISGGAGAIEKWKAAGLAQPDRVHLTVRGYRLRGELLSEALLRAFGPTR